VPSGRGRRRRRRSCNGRGAAPIKYVRYRGHRHSVAAVPSHTAARPCPS
jgi:hypothetical protein